MIKTTMMGELRDFESLNIIDVREEDEHRTGTIENALLIPMNDVPANLDKLDKNKEYHIVCASGGRSLVVSKFLNKQGYKVTNVLGGMGAYKGALKNEL